MNIKPIVPRQRAHRDDRATHMWEKEDELREELENVVLAMLAVFGGYGLMMLFTYIAWVCS